MGTKSGEILVYDVAASTLVESVAAHSGAVWSIHVRPDEHAFVTGSADKDIKFWEFERKTIDGVRASRLMVRTCIDHSLAHRAPNRCQSCTSGH